MVLTVTINPLLEKRLSFTSFRAGSSNRANNEILKAGGKGINVSRQLNRFGIENTALTFAGGNNGKIFRKVLNEEGIDTVIIPSAHETRYSIVAHDEKTAKYTTIFSPDPLISVQESDQFKQKLSQMIRNCSAVIFAGSSPSPETDDIFAFGINEAAKNDKLSVLDSYGAHLPETLKSAPTVLHMNSDEIESSLKRDAQTFNSKIELLDYFYSLGIKMSYITDGSHPIYASKFGFKYKLYPPRIIENDSTGSGDAFTASIIYGLEQAMVFEDFSVLAVAAGSANAASADVCNVSLEDVEKLLPDIQTETIGKKMKLIDDSPTI